MANSDPQLEEVSKDTIALYDHPLIFYKRWLGRWRLSNALSDEAGKEKAKRQLKEFENIMPEIVKLFEEDQEAKRADKEHGS